MYYGFSGLLKKRTAPVIFESVKDHCDLSWGMMDPISEALRCINHHLGFILIRITTNNSTKIWFRNITFIIQKYLRITQKYKLYMWESQINMSDTEMGDQVHVHHPSEVPKTHQEISRSYQLQVSTSNVASCKRLPGWWLTYHL